MPSFDTQKQTQTRSQQQPGKTPAAPTGEKKSSTSPALWAAIGGAAAAAVVAVVMIAGGNEVAGTAERPALSLVAQNDVDQAATTLVPEQKTKIVEEAKACKTPLAMVRLTKETAQGSGILRVRSGNYVSPSFTVADTPVAVAIPFPAPYSTGKGEISIEGVSKDVSIQLTPAWNLNSSQTSQTTPVVWKTNKPCG